MQRIDPTSGSVASTSPIRKRCFEASFLFVPTFTAEFYASNVSSILVRFLLGPAALFASGEGSGWSSFRSVTPDPLDGVPSLSALGTWAPEGLMVIFGVAALATVVRRRYRPAKAV